MFRLSKHFTACLIAWWIITKALMAQGYSPEDALKRMKPADGLEVQLVAAEPLIRQPVTMTFDTRGRLWVIQYLQYPTPAGLKAVEVDQYLRTKYDQTPLPPPHGPRGKDRVTILYDQDASGRYRQSKDFVNGLNLASGLALGNDGVYVLQAPYLLFYPDRNHDDVPDGDPQVLLSGFGLEDAHAVGNSLVWGPDGWLYGAQGSTVTAHITDPLTKKAYEFQQGIWRYHPITKQFELFAEGGGNTWGLDFDQSGQIIAGTNWGGVAALHMVQGGYYVKGFAKHGQLHNPHTYGYFEHIPCQGFRGGHVTCGGIIYQGKFLPEKYQQVYLGCNLLDNNLYWYSMKPAGSSFTMKHEGTLLQSNDTWFRPIDLLTGPDGAVYVCDWYDKRANHVDPVDNWDRSNGRIYRLMPKDQRVKNNHFDLNGLSAKELIALLKHENSWQRGEARRLLCERQDEPTRKTLLNALQENYETLSIDLLGAVYANGGVNAELFSRLLTHPSEDVRAWSIRLLGDHLDFDHVKKLMPVFEQLPILAPNEKNDRVRSQLACTAKRLIQAKIDAALCCAILQGLIRHDEDVTDPHLPLLIWWAMEEWITTQHGSINPAWLRLDRAEGYSSRILSQVVLERLARRLMAEGTGTAYQALSQLIETASHVNDRSLLPRLFAGMEKALEGRRLTAMPQALDVVLRRLAHDRMSDVSLTALMIRLGDKEAYATGATQIQSKPLTEPNRIKLLDSLSQGTPSLSSEALLSLFGSAETDGFRLAILSALSSQTDQLVSSALIKHYTGMSNAVRQRIISVLASRSAYASALAQAVDAGVIPPKALSLDQIQQIVRYHDPQIDKVVAKHWGSVTPLTTGEKQARIRSVVHMLGEGKGDITHGKLLFTKNCGTCHTLFGEGGKVGPELTGADRANRDFLATHIVDPNLVIRPEFAAHTVVTSDGRTLTGLIAEQNTGSITLLDAQANKITLSRQNIEDLEPSRVSLMPEKLLDPLEDQQIRDLFAYLQQPAEPKSDKKTEAPPFPSQPLVAQDRFDFADKMVSGIDRFLDQELRASAEKREARWRMNSPHPNAYTKLIELTRERWRSRIGAVEERAQPSQIEYISTINQPSMIGQGSGFDIHTIRWRAFGQVDGEGLLLVPQGKIKADVVALPDADQIPEQLAGLVQGVPGHMQFARQLAEQGCRVLVPTLINRSDNWSGVPGIRMTNQPHREWIYRQAFEMGRHIIGYEVLKTQAAIDCLKATQTTPRPVGLIGYGEGGLIAFHTGALDEHVQVTCVEGYFGPRDEVWKEPIYRNVWQQLTAFGDAELACLYAPRKLIVGQMSPPIITGPPLVRSGRSGAAPGRIEPFSLTREWNRFEPMRKVFPDSYYLSNSSRQTGIDLNDFYHQLTGGKFIEETSPTVKLLTALPVLEMRDKRQFDQLSEHTQSLLRQSQAVREKNFWSRLDRSSLANYQNSIEPFRQKFEKDVIGKIDKPLSAPNVRSRKLYDQPAYTVYEVELDVFAPDVIAYGWLLFPKGIKSGERRPVVVCQHGLEGRPADVADFKFDSPYYHQFACKLAERGFVVFAPQNPYIFGDRFRMLQRKANPLGLSFFSFIVAQHRQITDWLAGLSFVDPQRIGFYGLSYGGKTAMRVPALVPRYCLSICSADFNEWVWKNVANDNPYTYLLTSEWEMVEWNLGHTFNYAEMAALIAPRPFMVERGHHDGVAPDEQVAYEYAKVRRHYAALKIPDRTAIEFFDGPHTIHGVGTFHFLHQHLNWPEPK